MAHFHSNALIGASGGSGVEPPGNRSIRFNSGDSAHFSKTFSSAGNRDTWTWSAWIKITDFSASDPYNFIFGAGASDEFYICQRSSQELHIRQVTGGSEVISLITDQEFRDVAGWGHLVVAVDTGQATSSNRIKVYWNGSQITSFSTSTYPSQNLDTHINNNVAHYIGKRPNGSIYLDAYLTDIHFVDGSALLPTAFGAFDSNGVWQKGTYSGSYGTNGFHIFDFANEAEIGGDSSGNGNDFTPNNISDTDGVGLDLLLDFPKNGSETDSGAGGEVSGNYCTWSPLAKGSNMVLKNGNLDIATTSGKSAVLGTIGMSSGKWYWETTINGSSDRTMVAIGKQGMTLSDAPGQGDALGWGYYADGGVKRNDGTSSSYGAGFDGGGDVIGCAFDADNGTLTFYKNGSSQGVAFTGLTDGPYFPATGDGSGVNNANSSVNFGQRAWAYSAPSNHKALCTTNLPTPTIADGSDHFATSLWTVPSGSANTTISGLSFAPDWLLTKNRSQSYEGSVYDTVRGDDKYLKLFSSSGNAAEATAATRVNLTSDGFVLEADNDNSNYNAGSASVGWTWNAGTSTGSNNDGSINSNVRANQSAGISIVTYTGNNTSGATVGHGLNAAPDFIVIKRRSGTENWLTYNRGIGATKAVFWNLTDATHSNAAWFNNTNPSSSVFTLGSGNNVNNGNGSTYVAYCFAPVEGFSSFGTYVGNGSTDGPFIHTGFKPAFFMTKHTQTSGYDWAVNDAVRNTGNPASNALFPSSAAAEDSTRHVDLLGNGVKVRNSSPIYNQSGITYVYVAFASNPFQANGGLAR